MFKSLFLLQHSLGYVRLLLNIVSRHELPKQWCGICVVVIEHIECLQTENAFIADDTQKNPQ